MENTITDATEIRICTEMDVLRARKHAVKQAAYMGFRDIAQAEIEIAVSELGTNIVKHARSQGTFWISPAQAGPMTMPRFWC
jgi:anti-sigma regulatory factor (Ser/Thr protein kinase)